MDAERACWVYILQCGDGSYYTGSTTDLSRRLAAHSTGKGAKYTRGRGPLKLVYRERQPDWPSALRREAAVKRLTRAEKAALIAQGARREYDAPVLTPPLAKRGASGYNKGQKNSKEIKE